MSQEYIALIVLLILCTVKLIIVFLRCKSMNICTNKDSENERNLIKAENNLSASEELKL